MAGGWIAWIVIGLVAGFTGLNPWSFLVAVVGAIILLVIYHAIFGRTRTA